MVAKNKVNWLYLLKCCGSYSSLDMWLDLLTFEPSKVILQDFKIDLEFNIVNLLSNVNIPTLILVGSNDILALPEYAEEMHEKINNSELIVVQKAKHMLPIVKSKEVSSFIRKFINS